MKKQVTIRLEEYQINWLKSQGKPTDIIRKLVIKAMNPKTIPKTKSNPSKIPNEYFSCPLKGIAFKIAQLPCIADLNFNCLNKRCEDHVMDLIK